MKSNEAKAVKPKPILSSLFKRSTELELMDRLDTPKELLVNTLRHFSVFNQFFSCHRRLLKRYIIADMLKERQRKWRLLDLGAGGCDIDLWLTRTCRKRDLKLDIVCIDHDPRVVDYAKKHVMKAPNIKVICADVMEVDKLAEHFDYVFANHLLHHFESKDIEIMLKKINMICDRILLINDLLRCYSSYLVYTAIAAFFFHHSFAYTDGRISIKKGFTRQELAEILCSVGLKGETVVDTAFPGHIYVASCCRHASSSGRSQ